MANIFGKEYTKEELLEKTGNISQVCGIREVTYNSGRAKGVDVIDVDAGNLKFTVLNSRCLDIGQATYKGYPFSYLSKSGLRAPEYFVENKGRGFFDSFYGGLMVTSGLNNIGAESTVDGRDYGVHGEVANIPAELISKRMYWDEDEMIFEISGQINHSRFYAEDLVLTRTIQTKLGANSIKITDNIENKDFIPTPFMLLYHINFGFPFLDANSRLYTSKIKSSRARTFSAEKGLGTYNEFSNPFPEIEEECFYHEFEQEEPIITACLFNPMLGENGMGVYIKVDRRELPVFLQWKMMRSREYVCGLNPATNFAEGRKSALDSNQVKFLNPFEKRSFTIEIGITEGDGLIKKLF